MNSSSLLSPSTFVPLLLLIVVAAVLKALLSRQSAPKLERKPLLTKAELRFWTLLRAACPDHVVAPQVAMGALLKPRSGQTPRDAMSARGRFSQKIVDFAVIDPASGDVVALVELDDSTHNPAKDAARDALLAQGKYLVLRFPNKPWPNADTVRAALLPAIVHNSPTAERPARRASS